MQSCALGSLFETSAAALGGGGIGQLWGATSEAEAVATVRAAADAGIRMFDMAPLYGSAEQVIGQAFQGKFPNAARVSTKCMLGTVPAGEVMGRLTASLDESCARMRRPFIDVLFLHGYVIEDGWHQGPRAHMLDRIAMPWTLYSEAIVPALEALVGSGRIGAWGITSSPTTPATAALTHGIRPGAIQCVVNALNSSGNMNVAGGVENPAALVKLAKAQGVGVMAVRALAAGSLTAMLDRPVESDSAEATDYRRAAGLRELAKTWGVAVDELAYRYALSYPGVDQVVLGVKNRTELAAFVRALSAPRLTMSEMTEIRQSVS